MNKPAISENFTVEDIRKIREYNSIRHIRMTPEEIIEDTRCGAEKILKMLEERKALKVLN